MKEPIYDEIVHSSYSVCAVILGADESLLYVKLKDGFSFKKMSLIPCENHLDQVLGVTAMELRRDYECALIDKDALSVICAVKNQEYDYQLSLLDERFQEDMDSDIASLDNQIRIIRLLFEGPVRFDRITFHRDSEWNLGQTIMRFPQNGIVRINEALATKEISRFHCTEQEADAISKAIAELTFPLCDSMLNACHRYYDLSYHSESYISITLLTTALEILFLKKNEDSKKERLAKRCAAYLFDEEALIQETYDNIKNLYKKRSEFVHDGKTRDLTDEDIIVLRDYVRRSLLKALSNSEDKQCRIVSIKKRVTEINW